jgi:hypothetical protein
MEDHEVRAGRVEAGNNEVAIARFVELQMEKIYEARLRGVTDGIYQEQLGEYSKPKMATEKIKEQIWDLVLDRVLMERQGNNVPLTAVWQQENERFIKGVRQVTETRIPQAREATGSDNEMFVAFNSIDSGEEGVPYHVMTVYRPENGWSVGVADRACAHLAVEAIKNYLEGKPNERFTFDQDAERAVREENLIVNKEDKSIVFKGVNGLDMSWAVFHPGDGLKQAMETIRMAGDPLDGEIVFFHQMIVCQNERKENPNTGNERVVITVD